MRNDGFIANTPDDIQTGRKVPTDRVWPFSRSNVPPGGKLQERRDSPPRPLLPDRRFNHVNYAPIEQCSCSDVHKNTWEGHS